MDKEGQAQRQGSGTGNGPFVVPGNAADNERMIRRMYGVLNEHSASKMQPFMADNHVLVDVPTNRIYKDQKGFAEYLNTWINAFPDYKLEVTNLLATEDKCAVEFTARATHTGPLVTPMGTFPPTNKRIELKFSESYEIVNGKVTRTRSYWDTGSLMSQIAPTTH
jgi:steroid delta-isomerase-like uncharacterized protein